VDLSGNTLADLSPLAGLTNLSVLSLNGNPLTNLAALGKPDQPDEAQRSVLFPHQHEFCCSLTRLDSLDIRGNRMADITPAWV